MPVVVIRVTAVLMWRTRWGGGGGGGRECGAGLFFPFPPYPYGGRGPAPPLTGPPQNGEGGELTRAPGCRCGAASPRSRRKGLPHWAGRPAACAYIIYYYMVPPHVFILLFFLVPLLWIYLFGYSE